MEADLSEAELADFPSVASPASCGQYEAVLVDKGGGTFGVGYRQSPSRFPGEVISYAGDELNMPPGWMVCDGRALDTTEYPSLYTAIGYSWGRTDDLFHLPDLRGRFLRGVDMGEGVDPDADARTAINGGSTGDAVGTYQEDAFQKHKHELENTMEAGSAVGTDTVIKTNTNLLLAGDVLLEVGVATEAGGGEPRVAVETRPVNAAVIFIIFTGCQIEL
jgi:microcystin-dependent protein